MSLISSLMLLSLLPLFKKIAELPDSQFPDLRSSVNQIKMIYTFRLEVPDRVSRRPRGCGVLLADLDGHAIVGGAVDQHLRDAKRQQGRGRGGCVAFWRVIRACAQQSYYGIVAQVELIGQVQIKHARQADRAGQRQRLFSRANGTLWQNL